MTRKEIIMKAIEGKLTWIQAAQIIGVTDRQMRRMKQRYEAQGLDGIIDRRSGGKRRERIKAEVIDQVLTLRRAYYHDFSVAHFHEFATQKHGIEMSQTWMRKLLQDAGLAEKAPARGKHRRARERRPMRGMLLHLDASTHAWLQGLPKQDLNVCMDDADSRVLHAQFVPQEGTMSTLEALNDVLRQHGRFCELYTDRGSHFCTTTHAGSGPDALQNVQAGRALKALGIQLILARSPQARGRSERLFRTIQGRLPQELRAAGITTYAEANKYLQQTFIPALNERFCVPPQQAESAFTPLMGLDVSMTLSIQHERIVRPDNTISFQTIIMQLPKSEHRLHFVRCPVTVHQFTNRTLGISYQGRLLGTYDQDGREIDPYRLTNITEQAA
jgi:transposase